MVKKMKIFNIPESDIRHKASTEDVFEFAVGIVVYADNKILVLRRVPHDFLGGYYELPGGGVEGEETFENAVIRELAEETGLKTISISGMFAGFDYTLDGHMVRQINFVSETASGDLELNPEEHDDALWIEKEDLNTLKLSDEMKQCIEKAFNYLNEEVHE
jgi:8-oxo-dGTP diphosphatase